MTPAAAAAQWFVKLTPAEMKRVREWLVDNPPPDGWKGSRIEWAYLEITLFEWLTLR